MNWVTLIPVIISFIQSFTTANASPTPPPRVLPRPESIPAGAVAHPSQAIMDLQTLLNVMVKPVPALKVDGWIGPKTEAAIESGIALLMTKGVG